MTELRSRVAQFVIDVGDLDQGVAFWSAVLDATEEALGSDSQPIYRRLKLPDSDIRILLQRTDDPKASKERMHLDLETNDVEAEVRRIEGARRDLLGPPTRTRPRLLRPARSLGKRVLCATSRAPRFVGPPSMSLGHAGR